MLRKARILCPGRVGSSCGLFLCGDHPSPQRKAQDLGRGVRAASLARPLLHFRQYLTFDGPRSAPQERQWDAKFPPRSSLWQCASKLLPPHSHSAEAPFPCRVAPRLSSSPPLRSGLQESSSTPRYGFAVVYVGARRSGDFNDSAALRHSSPLRRPDFHAATVVEVVRILEHLCKRRSGRHLSARASSRPPPAAPIGLAARTFGQSEVVADATTSARPKAPSLT